MTVELLLQGSFLLVTYGVAAVPFGLVVTTLWGDDTDLRASGSGNIGATNVARVFGWRLALPVVVLDVAKGWAPVVIGRALWPDAGPAWAAIVALTAFVGHCWPIYLEFQGGKGVATGAGALLAFSPWPTGIAIALWAAILAITGRSSVASLAAAAGLLVAAPVLDPGAAPITLVLVAGVALTHSPNIRRLLAGQEAQVVRPVRWNQTPALTAAQALAQDPAGRPVAADTPQAP